MVTSSQLRALAGSRPIAEAASSNGTPCRRNQRTWSRAAFSATRSAASSRSSGIGMGSPPAVELGFDFLQAAVVRRVGPTTRLGNSCSTAEQATNMRV
jgi:hypothetical protein